MSLSVIIVNWNGKNFILDCITSIVQNPPSVACEIILVDNASSDGSVEWMQSESFRSQIKGDVGFKIIANEKNLGYGKANNIGFKSSSSDILFVLNPDAIVQKGALDKLIDVLQSEADIAMTAPQIVNEKMERETSVWSGQKKTIWPMFVYYFQLQRIFRKINYREMFFRGADAVSTCSVDNVSGAAMMVKRETINTIGGFDEDFFMYGEDLEWCRRIKKNKKKIFFVPEATVIHSGGKSSEKKWNDEARTKKMMEARILVERKTRSFMSYKINIFVGGLLQLIVFVGRLIFVKKPNSPSSFLMHFKAFFTSYP